MDGQMAELEHIESTIVIYSGRLKTLIREELLLFVWLVIVNLSALVELREKLESGKLGLENLFLI